MTRFFRPFLALAAGFVVATGFAAGGLQAAQTARAKAPIARDMVWGQTLSDLKPDSGVRFGTLPNGMRYALMHNATPKGQVSFRMRVGTGSLEETDAQQGLAHFLEHMAFNGSTKVPPGEMVKILERHGLAFGADTNASTDWTQTVYQLDLPQSDADTVDTGLMLLREQAGELLIDAKPLGTERGVVLSEERARDTPGYRIFKSRLEFLLKNRLAARRMPIGTVDVIRTAPPELLRSYYQAYYRPERTTFIAVGDFDVAAMEAKIKASFSNWSPKGPPGPEPNLGAPIKHGPETKLVVEPGGSLNIELSWEKPYDDKPDTTAERRRGMVEHLGFAVLDRRLERMARGENPPFLSAGAGSENTFRSAKFTSLSVTAQPDGWRTALEAAEQAQRRAVQYGVRQDEVDREITELRAAYTQAAAAAATRRSPSLASGLVDSVDEGDVFTSPADDLALFERAVKGLKATEVSAALAAAFQGQGPNLFMASPKPIEGGEATVATAYAKSRAVKVQPIAGAAAKAWPYQSFGTPGQVADRRTVADLDATMVRFANGVKLTVKSTKFRDQQVLVSVHVGHGRLEMPKDRTTASWAAGFSFTQGGLKKISLEEMEEVLASKIFSANLGVGDEAFTLSGGTRPADFDTELQVLAAYVSEPGWRPEGFQRMRAFGDTLLRQMQATPNGVLRRDLGLLLHSGDRRWSFPDAATIAAQGAADLKALLEQPLANGASEVVIVGDIPVDQAIQQVAATFGALPSRPASAPVPPAERQVAFPGPTTTPVTRTHGGRADQAIAFMAWPMPDFFSDTQRARALRLVERVMDLRLIDEIRVAQGATYSPSTDWDASLVFPDYGYLSASVEIPPAKVDGFFADVGKIAADLRTKEVGADELDRARKPRIEALQKAKQTNEYWLGNLTGAQDDPRRLDLVRDAIPGLQKLTAADVKAAAATYLDEAKVWKLVVGPEAKAP
ncbi:MAG: insulinase family protein [Caulobacteraceae bacterium]